MSKRLAIDPPATAIDPCAIAPTSAKGPSRLRQIVALWRERRRSRLLLVTLNDRLLRDIGLTAAEAEREATKPFWMA